MVTALIYVIRDTGHYVCTGGVTVNGEVEVRPTARSVTTANDNAGSAVLGRPVGNRKPQRELAARASQGPETKPARVRLQGPGAPAGLPQARRHRLLGPDLRPQRAAARSPCPSHASTSSDASARRTRNRSCAATSSTSFPPRPRAASARAGGSAAPQWRMPRRAYASTFLCSPRPPKSPAPDESHGVPQDSMPFARARLREVRSGSARLADRRSARRRR